MAFILQNTEKLLVFLDDFVLLCYLYYTKSKRDKQYHICLFYMGFAKSGGYYEKNTLHWEIRTGGRRA